MTGAVSYEIEHISRYFYTAPARQCVMLLCLEPCEDRGQRLLDFEIETQPPAGLNRETDCFGNTRHLLDLHRTHRILEITTRSTVGVASTPPLPARLHTSAWEEIRSLGESCAYWDFTHPSALVRPSPALAAFADRHRIVPRDDPLESLLQLSHTLHHCLHYIPGSTTVESPVEHILETGRGVCQDYAHLMIAIARSWGIPRPLCLGLSEPNRSIRRADHGQHHPRLGRMPAARAWLGRLRPNQPKSCGQKERAHRYRARLSRRVADARRPPRRRRNPPQSRCANVRLSSSSRIV